MSIQAVTNKTILPGRLIQLLLCQAPQFFNVLPGSMVSASSFSHKNKPTHPKRSGNCELQVLKHLISRYFNSYPWLSLSQHLCPHIRISPPQLIIFSQAAEHPLSLSRSARQASPAFSISSRVRRCACSASDSSLCAWGNARPTVTISSQGSAEGTICICNYHNHTYHIHIITCIYIYISHVWCMLWILNGKAHHALCSS